MEQLVSCIMANYNTEEIILRESIESILKQTYKNFEFIIVDDCSVDSSYYILQEYAKKDSRIIVIKNDENYGLAASLNKAMDMAKGVYITRMDTDDIAIERRFEYQVKYMNNHKDVDISASFAKMFGDKRGYQFTPFYSNKSCRCHLLFTNCLVHPTVIMRSEFIRKNNIRYNEEYRCSQDFELWARCSDIGKIDIMCKVLLKYRIHNKQMSIEKRELQVNYAKKICKMRLDALNIDYTSDEFESHMALTRLSSFNINDTPKIHLWINKVLLVNEKQNILDQKELEIILYQRLLNLILGADSTLKSKFYWILKCRLINFRVILAMIKRCTILLRLTIVNLNL